MYNQSNVNPWLVKYSKTKMPKMRFFCFPYAGGSSSIFREWIEYLPDDVEVLAVQPPGRESRFSEKPIRDIHEMTDLLLEMIKPYLNIPFIFFGHSTGAFVAYILSHKLAEINLQKPEILIVSGSRAPHIPEEHPVNDLPENEFIDELRKLSGTPDAILENKEFMKLYLPVLRADLALEENYVHEYKNQLDIPINAFSGSMDDVTPTDLMKGWIEHTKNSFHLKVIKDGDHFFVNNKRDILLDYICKIIDTDKNKKKETGLKNELNTFQDRVYTYC